MSEYMALARYYINNKLEENSWNASKYWYKNNNGKRKKNESERAKTAINNIIDYY